MDENYQYQRSVTGSIKSYNKSIITLKDSTNVCLGTGGTIYTKNGLVRFKVVKVISDTEVEIELLISIDANDPIMFLNAPTFKI